MGNRVTVVDVARKAGVAVGTASDALNGRGRLAHDTRRRVEAVAVELGYRPRSSARALRRGKTMCVGLRFGLSLLPQDHFVIDLLNGAATAAHARGYGLLISAPDLDEADMVDGLIVVDPTKASDVDVPDVKVITIGRVPGVSGVPSVDLDYAAALELLLGPALPAARPGAVCLLNVPTDASFGQDLAASLHTWCRAHAREAVVVDCDENERSTRPALEAQLERRDRPAIVMAPTGRHAEVAQEVLSARGIKVPEDVVLVSTFADRASRSLRPPVPATDPDGWGHGQRAAEAMVTWLETGTEPGDIRLSPRLI